MVYKKRKTDIVSLIKRMLDLILLFEVENIFLLRMRSHESRKKKHQGSCFTLKSTDQTRDLPLQPLLRNR